MNAFATDRTYSPLRVMHVLLTMGVGGAEKLVYDIINHLDPKEFCSSVCCLQDMGSLGDKLRDQGIPVFLHERSPGVDWSIIGWLRQLIKARQIDVIHAHQYTPMFYATLATAGLRRVRVVYTEHGRLYPERWSWKRYLLDPLLALGVDHIVSISESTKRAMIRYDNFPARKVKVIHNGVDFKPFQIAVDLSAKRLELGINETDRIIGMVARLEGIKNFPMALSAFKKVLATQPDALLLIAGIGSQEESLKILLTEMGTAERVKFLGLRFDLAEIYPLFELFLLTSFTEGISITLLEAMANRIPAVVTDVGGNSEVVIDGETGFLVGLDDDSAMAMKIMELLKSPECAQRMGKRAMERVISKFSFQRMMNNYIGLYE